MMSHNAMLQLIGQNHRESRDLTNGIMDHLYPCHNVAN